MRKLQSKLTFPGVLRFLATPLGVASMVLLSIVLPVLASAQESSGMKSKGESSGENFLREQMLDPGFMLGEPIHVGFLFIDGQYVPRPYRVIRDGKIIKINGYPLPFDAESHDRRNNRRWIQMDEGFSGFGEEWGMGEYQLPSWLRSTEASNGNG